MVKNEFVKICSDRKFWQWVKNKSLVSYGTVSDKDSFLKELGKRIDNRTYYPNPPKEYLTINKGKGVLRIVPVLALEDLCVYYYCVRKLEKYIALNHVPGTFGGFGLSGKLRQVEEEEIGNLMNEHELVEFGSEAYVFTMASGSLQISPLNPMAWFAEWNDFTKKLYFNSGHYTTGFVVELDISNFYDAIQLDILEFKLRKHISHKQNEIIYLLLHFLRYWNRHMNFYRQQGAGIPQDLFGECSRILANFYLQDYDKQISDFVSSMGGKFFRYADDQVIFANTEEDAEVMIAKASSLLMRIGLNFNQKKVNIMTIDEFQNYYSFDNFFKLAQKKSTAPKLSELNKQIAFYFKNKEVLRKKGTSLLKRIMGILTKMHRRPKNFSLLKKHLLSPEFLLQSPLQFSDLTRIYNLINAREKTKMIKLLDGSIAGCLYTNQLYILKQFYVSIKLSTRKITYRIARVNRLYHFTK
jgi:hypothetical protein